MCYFFYIIIIIIIIMILLYFDLVCLVHYALKNFIFKIYFYARCKVPLILLYSRVSAGPQKKFWRVILVISDRSCRPYDLIYLFMFRFSFSCFLWSRFFFYLFLIVASFGISEFVPSFVLVLWQVW